MMESPSIPDQSSQKSPPNDSPENTGSAIEPYILSDEKISDGTYTQFYKHVLRDILVFACIALIAAIYLGGMEATGGVLIGASVACLNFWWMKRSIITLTDVYSAAIAKQDSTLAARKPDVPVLPQAIRFFLRYLLIGSVAFVMMKNHRNAAFGFFSGLALPISALMVEGFRHFVFASGSSQKEI